MRKLVLSLSLALVLALTLSVSAFAAADLSATGDVSFRTAIAENNEGEFEFQGNWRTRANLIFKATRNNISASVQYRLRTTGFVPLQNTGAIGAWTNDVLEGWLDVKGAFLPGTPDVNLRVGRFVGDENRLIGYFDRRDGVLLSGLNVGPATLSFYHGWITPTYDDDKNLTSRKTVWSVKGTTKIDVVDLTGIYVAHRDFVNEDAASADYMVQANITPASGVKAGVEFANNGANEASYWKVSGELGTIDNLKLRAATWSTDNNFAPAYVHNTNREKLTMDRTWVGRPTLLADPWIAKGFSIGASTTQAGLPIDVDFKSGTTFDIANAAPHRDEDINVLSVGTTIAEIKTGLTYTKIADHDPVIDLTGTRTLASSILGGNVTLKGTVRFQDDESKFATDATWRAPNGLMIGLHYANYDRKLDWDHNNSNDDLSEGIDIGKPGEADGFAITVGHILTF